MQLFLFLYSTLECDIANTCNLFEIKEISFLQDDFQYHF